MALWKPFKGTRAELNQVPKHDGYVYFCDDGTLFYDYTDENGNLLRKQINAKDAETLCGKTLEELKEYFGSGAGPGGTTSADWQAPEGEPGHVLNRTHWKDEDITVTEILPETTLSAFDMGDGTMVYAVESGVDIQADKNYTIDYRGVEYNCTAVIVQGFESELYLGNIYALGAPGSTPSNEPFAIIAAPEDGSIMIVDIDGNTDDLTISINYVEDNSIYHKLDAKYIPDEVMDRLPEWIEGGEGEEILPETELLAEGDADDNGLYYNFVLASELDLIDGGTYIVKYNGVEYATTALSASFEGIPLMILGDAYTFTGGMVGTESTGERFVLAYLGLGVIAPDISGSFMPYDGAESATISIHSANSKKIDPSQIKDMYYEESGADKVIIPKIEIIIADGSYIIDRVLTFEVDKNYLINYNGTVYKCKCWDAASSGTEVLYVFGDVYAASGGMVGDGPTGEPFIICITLDYEYSQTNILIDSFDGSESVTLSIEQPADIHKINNKYLDLDWIPKVEYGPGDLLYSTTVETSMRDNHLRANIKDLASIISLSSGQYVFVKINGNAYRCQVQKPSGFTVIGSLGALINGQLTKDEPIAIIAYTATLGDLILFPSEFSEGECVLEVYTSANANVLPEEFLPTSFQGNTHFMNIDPEALEGQLFNNLSDIVYDIFADAGSALKNGKTVFIGPRMGTVLSIFYDNVDRMGYQVSYAIPGAIYTLTGGNTTRYIWKLDKIDITEGASADDLATVATTGSYNDLIDKPELFSGSYNDLTDKPEIPSLDGYYTKNEVDELIPDVSGFITEIPSEYVTETELNAKGYATEELCSDTYIAKNNLQNAFHEKYSKGLVYATYTDAAGVTIGCKVQSIGSCTDTDIIIPRMHNCLPVTGILARAFENVSITSIEIPEGIDTIYEYAFANCKNLIKVILPNSVTDIRNFAFYNCSALTNITLGSKIKFIGASVFQGCTSLIDVAIPNSVTEIGGYVFSGCLKLTRLIIPASVTTIGSTITNLARVSIYCEAKSKPSNWNTQWNYYNCPVTWDFANDFVSVNERIDAVVSGGGSPGGSTTNVSWNDLTDRPFYTETVEVLPETTLTVDPETGETMLADTINVVAGNRYIVTWNGTDYTCNAIALPRTDDMPIDAAVIGNWGVIDGSGDNGMPFVLIIVGAEYVDMLGMGVMGMVLDGSTAPTVKIMGEVVHTLDEKFIPESVKIGYIEYGPETVVLPETTVNLNEGAGILAFPAYDIFELEADRLYRVMFDGKTYETVAIEIQDNSMSGVLLGSMNEIGDSTMPFGILFCSYDTASTMRISVMVTTPDITKTIVTFSVTDPNAVIHKIPEMYIPKNDIKNITDGAGLGSVKTISSREATGAYSFAEGSDTTAEGQASHAEGTKTEATNTNAHAEGYHSYAGGDSSHAEGASTHAEGPYSHAEGKETYAMESASHAEGYSTRANGNCSHTEGYGTQADDPNMHVQGRSNKSTSGYAHVVGNGSSFYERSDAHTLDWDGNAWYAGTVEGTALIIKSSTADSTKRFMITVDDSGTLKATEITA